MEQHRSQHRSPTSFSTFKDALRTDVDKWDCGVGYGSNARLLLVRATETEHREVYENEEDNYIPSFNIVQINDCSAYGLSKRILMMFWLNVQINELRSEYTKSTVNRYR